MNTTTTYLEGSEFQRSRAFSPAVVTEGGKTVWLAGQTATVDASGADISGKLEAQAQECFRLIGKTLERTGGTLDNLVWMTVFVSDPRFGDPFVQLRSEILRREKPDLVRDLFCCAARGSIRACDDHVPERGCERGGTSRVG